MTRQLDTGIIYKRANEMKPDRFDIIFKAIILYLLVLFAIMWIFVSFTILGKVDGDSMLNTLHDGDYVLLYKGHNNIKVNNIVILPMYDHNIDIIKRVVAVEEESIRFLLEPLEKQTIQLQKFFDDEWVTVNEKEYLRDPMSRQFFDANSISYGYYDGNGIYIGDIITIPKGHVFVLGDNRNNSRDSRQEGAFDTSSIKGKVYRLLERGSFAEKLFRFIYGDL